MLYVRENIPINLFYQKLKGGSVPSTGNLTLAIVLVVVVLINVGLTFFQEHTSSKVMRSIENMLPSIATVIRDGVQDTIPANQLVPGDVVYLTTGTSVPADIRLMKVSGLKVDQSILTGESEPVTLRSKSTSPNYLETRNITFSGGSVVEGSGYGIVVSIGNSTMMGNLAAAYD